MKPLVYVAGPFRVPNPLDNTRIAVAVGNQIRDNLGVVDVVPHLSLLEDMMYPRPPEYWLEVTLDRMRRCDAVYRFNRKYSAGSDAEVAEAERMGIPVFYDIGPLRTWVKEWKEQHALQTV